MAQVPGPEDPENIRLIQQPSYSPGTQSCGASLEELREKYLPNKAFKSLDAVEEALCKGLRELHGDPDRVSSMTNFPYLQVTC